MRRRLYLPYAACLFLIMTAAPALAVIDNTHHDMAAYQGSFSCYACHGYPKGTFVDNSLGTIGSFCYNQCHKQSGGIAANMPLTVDYPNTGNENGALWAGTNTRTARGNMYYGGTASPLNKYGNGHMRDWSKLATSIDNDATTRTSRTTNWPHLSGTDMECTGCHDVHSNTYAPFLRKPLSIGTGAATVDATFCVACHTGSNATGAGRWNVVTASPNGAHPIETDSATANSRKGNPAPRQNRLINIKGTSGARNSAADNSSVFKALTLFATGSAGLGNPANHYRPGGKLGAMNTAADNGAVICITCHGVHLPGNVAGTNNLTYVTIGDQAADTELNNPICVACHGPGPTPTGTSNANPGTTQYYHPVNGESTTTGGRGTGEVTYTASTGAFTFVVNVGTTQTDLGSNLRLVCTSCHTYSHGGAPGTMLLTTRSATCEGCHDTTTRQGGTTANSHHVYGGQLNYTLAAYGGYSDPSYKSINPKVDLANGLSCEDCHVFNGTAHNW